jgi:hypothetical protein
MPPVRELALASYFATMDDPRIERTKAHNLLDIIIITICAVICGADDWVGVAEFGTSKETWLKDLRELPNGIPYPAQSLAPGTEQKQREGQTLSGRPQ